MTLSIVIVPGSGSSTILQYSVLFNTDGSVDKLDKGNIADKSEDIL